MHFRFAGIVLCGYLLLMVHSLADASLGDLEVGMAREDVISLLGEPRGRGSDGRQEILFYGANQEVHLQDGAVYMVTGSDGVIIERARGTEERSRSAESLFDNRTIRYDFSHSGPSFTMEGMEDAPPWALPALAAFWVAVMLFLIAQMWCLFVKAGWPGWTCLVPIYNAYVMLKIAGKPGWWFLLMLLPIINIVIVLILPFSIAARFGKGAGFGLGLLLFPILFYPILAFGSATYQPVYDGY